MQNSFQAKSYPLPDLAFKLDQSKRGAEKLVKREIRCPRCGFYLLDVYGTDHYYTRVKCQKCKFVEIIDTALFRTIRLRNKKAKVSARLEELTDEDLYGYLSEVRSRQ
jgi:phage FluMu protein Com